MYGLKLLANDCAVIDYSSDSYRLINYEEALQNMDMFYNVKRVMDKGLLRNYIGTGSLISMDNSLCYMHDLFTNEVLFTLTEIALPVVRPKDCIDLYLLTNDAFYLLYKGIVICIPREGKKIRSNDYHVVNEYIDYVAEIVIDEDSIVIDCVHVKIGLELSGMLNKYRKFTESQFKRFLLFKNG